MKLATYDEVTKRLTDEADSIANAKRPAYTTGSEDVLRNFKFVAERLGLTPMQVWGVYFLKHVDAITSVAKDPSIPQAEPIIGRFADATNYLKLGFAIINEDNPTA